MKPSLRRSTAALLASSLLLTIGRGATLPFMTIYLTRVYAMSVENIGYALTVALTIGVVFSMGFGILADKFDKKRYMLVSITAFIFGFIAIPLVDNVTLVVLFFALINCAYSVFATVLKAWFSDVLTPGQKAKIFSLNYSFLNIGWTIGPPIGTLLVMYSLQLPFWLAALCAALPLVFIQLWVQRVEAATSESAPVAWQPSILLKDRALFWYTLSGLLASYVGGSFASCISQYVLAADYDSDFAQQVVAVVLPVNAAMVVSLQYLIGRKFDKKRYMLVSITAFIFGFIAIPLVDNVTLVVLFFALINCAYSVFATVLKAWFSDVLTPGQKAKIFSLNYSFLNIGWTIGPPIGTLLVMYSLQLPFWLAALCAALPLVFIQLWVQRVEAATSESAPVAWQPSILLKDRALFWYTLSGLLASYVGGSFASCISQYVLAADYDSDFAQQVVAVVLPVNAAMVVSLQYLIGRKLTGKNIRPLMTLGTLFFVLGLAGFMVSGNNLIYWGVAAAIFTVGEIIYAPGEYMLIDNIAPPGMKASYFSAQALGWLGAAFNPMITGIILTHLPHWSLFAIMMVAIVIAWLMILRGMNVKAWQGDVPETV